MNVNRRTFIAGATAIGAGALISPKLFGAGQAHATEAADIIDARNQVSQQIIAMRNQLATDADNYYKALEEYEAAQKAVQDAQGRIDAETTQITQLQEQLSDRIKSMYRTGDITVIDVLMGSNSFEEFATQMDLLDRLNSGDAALVDKTKDLREQVEAEKVELSKHEEEARQAKEQAEEIKDRAEKATEQLQDLYSTLDAQAKELIEKDQAASLSAANWNVQIIGNPRDLAPVTAVVDYAKSRLGCPYVWGAAGPNTFDCSGLVVWSYAQAGVAGLPHYTESLYARALASGAVLALADVEPGDVLYRPGHVGIAMGQGGVPYIHAPNTGALVRDTDTLAWAKFVCGLRFPS